MEKYNLTYPQQNIWLVESFYNNQLINIISGSLIINKDFDTELANKSVNKFVELNAGMRIKIFMEEDTPKQYIGRYKEFVADKMDVSSKSETEINKIKQEYIKKPIDIIAGPLYQYLLLDYGNGKGEIFLKSHHLICDGWSGSKMVTGLADVYEKLLNKQTDFVPFPSYEEYIKRENEYKQSSKFKEDESFWKDYLKGFKEPVGIKENPGMLTKAKRYSVTLDEKLNKEILDFCSANKLSPYSIFMTALAIYLERTTEKQDIIIGTPILNRSNFSEKQMQGMFVSTMPVRFKVDENTTFKDMCIANAKESMTLFRHQKFPFAVTSENFKKDSGISDNMYRVMLSYQNARAIFEKEDVYRMSWTFSGEVQDELGMHIVDLNDDGILEIDYDYIDGLYEKGEIEYIASRIHAIIQYGIENNKTVGTIEIMSEEEKNKIIYEFNNTKRDYPKDKTVIELFEEQVEKTPDNIALVFEDEHMTYEELNIKANDIAMLLNRKGITQKDIVALSMKKSIMHMITLLALLKLGVCYVPMDETFSNDRTKYILENSNCKFMIVDRKIGFKANKANIINILEILEENQNVVIEYIDQRDSNYTEESLFHIMYTSGTTGNPKGVMLTNKNIIRLVKNTNYIDFRPSDRVIQAGSMVFDASTFEYWGALLNGSALYLISKDNLIEPEKLESFLQKNSITVMLLTAALLNQMVEYNPKMFGGLRVLLSGGDVMSVAHANKIIENCPHIEMINAYGPTENATISTTYIVSKVQNKKISIGKPISNTTCYTLDSKSRLLPLFIEGELAVGGDGVAKGYINNKELTNDKFIKPSFGEEKILYKTGDISKILPEGNIDFIGRRDNQVKIRGFRVELDEIKNTILNYKGVKDAVVLVKNAESSVSNKQICLYYVSKKTTIQEVIEYLKSKLPFYMIPSHIINIDEMPITNNGKVDVNKLPETSEQTAVYSKEKIVLNEMQTEIQKIVNKVIGIKMNLKDNMFDNGLDSLICIKLSNELSQHFNVNVTVKSVFDNPTIEALEKVIINSKTTEGHTYNIEKEIENENFPLSSGQFGIFVNYTADPNRINYNIPFELRISKKVDVEKLINCFEKVIIQNKGFQTRIKIIEGEIFQYYDNIQKVTIKHNKMNQKEYMEYKQGFVKPFDLLNEKLYRVELIETENSYCILMDVHHIIFDGYSLILMLKQIKAEYEGAQVENIDENAYKKHVLYEIQKTKSEEYETAKQYFLEEFADEIPTDYFVTKGKSNNINSSIGNKISLSLNNEVVESVKAYAEDNGVTLNSLYLAAYNILLAKYMYSDDVVVGLGTLGRKDAYSQNTIGMFVKTVPFRTKINKDAKILEYIKSVQEKAMDMLEYDIYPYEQLTKDLKRYNSQENKSIINYVFVYQGIGQPKYILDNNEMYISEIKTNSTKFDITFEVLPGDEDVSINLDYNSELFAQDKMEKFLEHYSNILVSIISASKNREVSDINMLSTAEIQKTNTELNTTEAAYDHSLIPIRVFEKNAEMFPENPAVYCDEKSLTYSELNILSNKMANYLHEIGLRKQQKVSIIMDKSNELMISILAVLKNGAVYVPIEKDYPTSRIEYIVNDTDSRIIITDGDVEIAHDCIININTVFENIDELEMEALPVDITPKFDAYIMYTSGTTGNPKGVVINNQNIISLIYNTNYIEFNENDRVIQTGSTAFDATTFEYYGALFNALPLYLLKKEELLDLDKFSKFIKNNKITVMFLTTQLFNQVAEYDSTIFSGLRVLLTGGEAMSIKHMNIVKQACKNLDFQNVYGPTENTTFSTYYRINNTFDRQIPIGKPISNKTCYIIDKLGEITNVGIPGELVVGGDGVSSGYLNQSKITKEKFIKNPYNKAETLYKTGDLVWLNDDIDIEFIGRIDNQVKIRGFRIEPDEVNQKLLEYKKINESFVLVDKILDKIVLAAVFTSDEEIKVKDIIGYLKNTVPHYMIPTYLVRVEKIPVNSNGKTDRLEIHNIVETFAKENSQQLSTRGDYEGIYLKIYNIFVSLLNREDIFEDDNFFDIGGDSLNAIKLVTMAMADGINITYPDIYKYSTIRELGDMLEKNYRKDSISSAISGYDYSKINTLIKQNQIGEFKEKAEEIGNVLLTGVTGFLGAHILAEYIDNEKGKIYCLIRSKNEKNPMTRLKETLNFFFEDKYNDLIGTRIIPFEGDIVNENIITDKSKYNDILKEVNTVINSAAYVKHFGNVDTFYNINVNGIENLCKFCSYNKIKLIHISTLSVSGNLLEAGQLEQTAIAKNTIYDETRFFVGQNLDNVYAYTKFEGEKAVYDAIIMDGLNAKIMRMGNLTGRSTDGKFQPNVEDNAFANRLKTMIGLNVLPENLMNLYLEFTPIDYAAYAILNLAKTNRECNTFHLFNHKHAKMDFIDEVLREMDVNLKHISKENMTKIIEQSMSEDYKSSKIDGIVLDLNRNKELDYTSNIEVKSDFTIKVLKDMKFEWPIISKDYIKKYIGYLFEIGFLKKGE